MLGGLVGVLDVVYSINVYFSEKENISINKQ